MNVFDKWNNKTVSIFEVLAGEFLSDIGSSLSDLSCVDDLNKLLNCEDRYSEAESCTLDKVTEEFNMAIDHVIGLGMEGANFLYYWREGNWEACEEFGYIPSEFLVKGQL